MPTRKHLSIGRTGTTGGPLVAYYPGVRLSNKTRSDIAYAVSRLSHHMAIKVRGDSPQGGLASASIPQGRHGIFCAVLHERRGGILCSATSTPVTVVMKEIAALLQGMR